MAYALVGYFDEKILTFYNKLWQSLSELGYTDYGLDKTPHITLGDFDELNEEVYIKEAETFFDQYDSIPITLNQLGFFLGTETLYYAPTLSHALSGLHQDYYENFHSYHLHSSYYKPGYWVPHATIASRLDSALLDVFNYCKQFKAQSGFITRIALIEITLKEGIAISDQIIYEKYL